MLGVIVEVTLDRPASTIQINKNDKGLVMRFFKEYTISGSPRERGQQYGEQLASEIAKSLEYYKVIFNLPDPEILALAEQFRGTINDFNPDYMVEINAMAQAAGIDPLWIVALNARTEILSHGGLDDNPALQATECTAMCFPGSAVLGQTWDWGKPMEALSVIIRMEREDGHVITTLTEAGIIGKIGMNNAGVGVTLNILKLGEKLNGVPIHIMLRGILDCGSIFDAQQMIANNNTGKASNVIVASDTGQCFDTEFAGNEAFTLTPEGEALIHTNHYLGKVINAPEDPLFNSSYARFAKAENGVNSMRDASISSMLEILSDRTNAEYPIFRPYIPDVSVKELGTVFTVAMDLANRNLHVRKGADAHAPFKIYSAA